MFLVVIEKQYNIIYYYIIMTTNYTINIIVHEVKLANPVQ
jgi:hypothetical protein